MPVQPQAVQVSQPFPEEVSAEEKPMDFGEYLRKQRMLRGVTHEEIVRITKVRQTYVDALEKNDFDALPPRTFVLGFVRAISRYLGLDEDETVTRYLLVLQDRAAQASLEGAPAPTRRFAARAKSLRLLAWFGGFMLFFFIITLPHFLRN